MTEIVDQNIFNKIKSVDGWLGDKEIEFLFETARTCDQNCIVEIGNFRGKSTLALALGSKNGNKIPIYSIDPHKKWTPPTGGHQFGPNDRVAFLETLVNHRIGDIVSPIDIESHIIGKCWEDPISFLWIDGDHSYEGCRKDFSLWSSNVVEGGIIAFHDYTNTIGVKKVCDEIIEENEYIFADQLQSLRVIRKVS